MTKKDMHKLLATYLPESTKVTLYRALRYLQTLRLSFEPVEYCSTNELVYHCCVQRTASQWLKAILSDPTIYKYSGLRPFNTRELGLQQPFDMVLYPRNAIISPLYINYDSFQSQPKPSKYAAFFVARDPRDIVISHYFASRYSHTPMGDISERRRILSEVSIEHGLIYTIDYLQASGLFEALRSWYTVARQNPKVLHVKYEELVGANQTTQFMAIFRHCDIGIPQNIVAELLSRYRFERVSGHQRGTQNKHSHYRKGVPGDWQNYFTPKIRDKFRGVTQDLVILLGYRWGLTDNDRIVETGKI